MLKKEIDNLERIILKLISSKYCYLTFKKKEFMIFKDGFKKRLKKVKTYNDFIVALKRSLAIFDDSHIKISDKFGKIHGTWNSKGKREFIENYDSKLIKKILKRKREIGPITLGNIKDISYIGLDSFQPSHKKYFDEFSEKLDFPEDKFIIDLRANGGGNDNFIHPLVYFLLSSIGRRSLAILNFVKMKKIQTN